jgi:hypothetical protein
MLSGSIACAARPVSCAFRPGFGTAATSSLRATVGARADLVEVDDHVVDRVALDLALDLGLDDLADRLVTLERQLERCAARPRGTGAPG